MSSNFSFTIEMEDDKKSIVKSVHSLPKWNSLEKKQGSEGNSLAKVVEISQNWEAQYTHSLPRPCHPL